MNYKEKFYKKYQSTHTGKLYGELSIESIEAKFYLLDAYFGRFLPKNKDLQILDLGCGTGELVYWLKRKGFKNSEGVDVSEEQIQQAKQLNIDNMYLADIFDFLKNSKKKYDLIFARDLIEHFPKEQLLELGDLIFQSLNEEGRFVAQTPNAQNLFWGRLRHGDFTHDLSFTHQSIRQLLRVAGFNHVEVYPQRPVIHGLKSLIRYILWRGLELWPKFYLLVETGAANGVFTQNLIAKAVKKN